MKQKISSIKHYVPTPCKNFYFALMDLKNINNPFIPPIKLRRIIGQSETYTKDRTAEIRHNVILKPSSTLLDVGCGCGSLPYSLIHYTNFTGNYEGFDIVKEAVEWLSKNVTKAYPNFHFQHADIYNSNYNSKGTIQASKYVFPFKPQTFDCVFLSSVFTHMLPADLENYLKETARVLKPNGRCFASYFFHPQRHFTKTNDGYAVANLKCPEAAVAYPPEYINQLYKKYSFSLIGTVPYGPQIGHITQLGE